MKILIAKRQDNNDVFDTFFTEKSLNEIKKLGEVYYNEFDHEFTREELREALYDIDVVFTGWGVQCFDEYVLEKANKLKVIAHTGGSASVIVSDELAKRNILLLSGNRLYAESVAEGTICYILLAQRHLHEYIEETRELGWLQTYRHSSSLKRKTVGIIGFGMIAKNVVRILKSFDCKVKIYSSYLTDEEAKTYNENAQVSTLDDIFATCDIISVHSGLNDKNYHLIDKKYLSLMKDNSLIVNTARGAVINEEDLIEELKAGRIRAILDVYEVEPLPMDSGLRGLKNVILVPHKGGPTTDVREIVTIELCEDIKAFLEDGLRPKHEITLEYAKRMTNHSIAEKNFKK